MFTSPSSSFSTPLPRARALVHVIRFVAVLVLALHVTSAWANGCSLDNDGTWYFVASATDLQKIDGVDCSLDYNYEQTADIDLSGTDWQPMGSLASPFTGVYDGGGYKISNLTKVDPVDVSGNDVQLDGFGLFGALDGATVRSLDLRDVLISDTDTQGRRVGGVAGAVTGTDVTIDNVSFEGTISLADTSSTDVGGIIGFAGAPMEISNVVVSASTLYAGDDYVGGIVGRATAPVTFGTVTVQGIDVMAGVDYAGGLAGEAEADVTATNVSVQGRIEAGEDTAGGLVGGMGDDDDLVPDRPLFVENVTVDVVVVADWVEAGGLFGEADADSATIRNVRLTGRVQANDQVGGIIGDVAVASGKTIDVEGITFDGWTAIATEYDEDWTAQLGGLIGRVDEGTFIAIDDVTTVSTLTVSSTTGNDGNVAGLIGRIPERDSNATERVEITNVSMTVQIDGDEEVGGLLGLVSEKEAEIHVSNVTLRGSITGHAGNNDSTEVGGLIGDSNSLVVVRDVVILADLASLTNDRLGGLFGSVDMADIARVRIEGNITGGEDDVGGVIGVAGEQDEATDVVTMTDVVVTGNVKARRDVGGLIGQSDVPIFLHRVQFNASLDGTGGDGFGNDLGGLIGLLTGPRLDVREASVEGSLLGRDVVGGVIGHVNVDSEVTLRDVAVHATVTLDITGGSTGSEPVAGVIGALDEDNNNLTIDVDMQRVLVTNSLTGNATLAGGVSFMRDDTAVSFTDVYWNATATPDVGAVTDRNGGTVNGTAEGRPAGALRAWDTYASGTWSLGNGRPAVQGPNDPTWTLCTGAFPVLTWLAPDPCIPSSEVAASLEVGGFAVPQLRNIPFDVTVSVVDAAGEPAYVQEASTLVVSATGGAVPGELRMWVAGEAVAPRVTLQPGASIVTLEDVFYTGVSGLEGRDVTLTVTGLSGSIEGLVVSTSDLSVRDIAMDVMAEPASVLVNGVDTTTVTVTLSTATGEPVQGETITLSTTLGRFVRGSAPYGRQVEGLTDANGVVRWVLDPDGQVGVATITARCPGACPVRIDVPFVGEVEDLRVIPGDEEAWLYFAPLGEGVSNVQYRLDGGDWMAADPPVTRGPVRIDALVNGRTYEVEVQGISGEGDLPVTDPVAFTPGTVRGPLLDLAIPEDVGALSVVTVDGERRVELPVEILNDEAFALQDVWFTAPNVEGWTVVGFTTDVGTLEREAAAWHLRLVGAPLEPGAKVTLTLTLKQEVE